MYTQFCKDKTVPSSPTTCGFRDDCLEIFAGHTKVLFRKVTLKDSPTKTPVTLVQSVPHSLSGDKSGGAGVSMHVHPSLVEFLSTPSIWISDNGTEGPSDSLGMNFEVVEDNRVPPQQPSPPAEAAALAGYITGTSVNRGGALERNNHREPPSGGFPFELRSNSAATNDLIDFDMLMPMDFGVGMYSYDDVGDWSQFSNQQQHY